MRIAILALDEVYHSCVSGALDVIRLLGMHRLARLHDVDPYAASTSSKRPPPILIQTLSLDGNPVTAFGGTMVPVDGAIGERKASFDVVFVPAFAVDSRSSLERKLAASIRADAWLGRQWDQGATFIANHVAIYTLASAGVLGSETVTVPLAFEAHFRTRFPRIKLDMSRAVVESQRLLCGAGLGATYDLLLRLIQRDTSTAIGFRMLHDLFFVDSRWTADGCATLAARQAEDPLVERAQSWLVENLSRGVTVADMAHFLSTSERTLYRRFRRSLGMSPHDYLKSVRIKTSMQGLAQTKFTIEQVAASVGYRDPAFFSRQFKAHAGMTPAQFRRRGHRS